MFNATMLASVWISDDATPSEPRKISAASVPTSQDAGEPNRRVREERSFGDRPDENRCLAAFGRPAEPVAEVGVGAGGISHLRVLN
jgi:hypothetical protein